MLRFISFISLLAILSPWAYAELDIQIPNPSFEELDQNQKLAGWSLYGEVYSQDDSVAHSGTHSLRWKNEDPNRYVLSRTILKGLSAGESAKVSCWIKTENVSGTNSSVCVEYWDKEDQFISGVYLKGPRGTTDWKQISGTLEVPERTAYASLCCYAASGAVGTIWFDDLELVPVRLSGIQAMTTDRYRNQTEGGNVGVYVGYKKAIQDAKIAVYDANSKLVVEQPVFENRPEDRTLAFQLDSTPLPNGKYTLKAFITQKDTNIQDEECLTLEKVERLSFGKSYIDQRQRLIADGKAMFPIGLYTHNLTDEDIERFAQSPFNCVISYQRLSKETLDKMYKKGIFAIYPVTFSQENPEESDKAAAETIAKMKDHPAILAWYIYDEAPVSQKEELIRHYNTVKNADPTRAAIAVTDKPEEIRALIPTFDMIGTDPYPITRPWNLKLDASQAYDWTKQTHEAVWGKRLLVQVPQLFNWGIYNKLNIPPETFRRPTFDEMRAMTWMCIAGGGNGIVGYSYYDIFRFPENPKRTEEQKKTAAQTHWSELVKIMEELKSRVPILLSTEDDYLVFQSENKKIAARCYGYSGSAWILLVNTTSETQTAEFSPVAKVSSPLQILNPDELKEGKFSVEGAKLRVELPPLIPAWVNVKTAP